MDPLPEDSLRVWALNSELRGGSPETAAVPLPTGPHAHSLGCLASSEVVG